MNRERGGMMDPHRKSLRASYVRWASTALIFLIGTIVAVGGVIFELRMKDALGLIMIIVSPLIMAAAVILATVASKIEAEEQQCNKK